MSVQESYKAALIKAAAKRGVKATGILKKAGNIQDFKDIIADSVSMPGGMLPARREQILNEIADSDERTSPRAHAVAEMAGPLTSHLTSMAVGTGLGAGIGKLTGKENGAAKGALIGLAAGHLLGAGANLGAMVLAALRRRRTAQEQIENDQKSALLPLLVPGKGIYDNLKRQGRAFEENRDRIKERRAEKKAASKNIFDKASNIYRSMDPITRRAIIAGLATGAGSYLLSDNNVDSGTRLGKALITGAIGGLGMYGLDTYGGTDKLVDWLQNNASRLRPRKTGKDYLINTMYA